jgi:hypothetical protein
VSRDQRDGSLRPYSRFSRPEPLLFLPSSSSVVLARLSGARDDVNELKINRISGFHGGDYEDRRLVGCDAVWGYY